jgi:hypothetical protein
LILLFTATPTLAVPTHITVRVKSKDAKFVGDSMGGALVTIRDTKTGELLARGITTGSTGKTSLLMGAVPSRKPVSDERSGKFTATIHMDEPKLLEVSAYGPLAQHQAANRVSSTQWVVPGKHITGGDAWMLELPGFVVDILDPPTATTYGGRAEKIGLRVNIVMM